MTFPAARNPGSRPLSLAVLVDGENIPPEFAVPAIARATMGHNVLIRRVYGSPDHAGVWAMQHGYHGVYTLKNGVKNAADIALVMEAMEFALRDRVEGFVLASSDGDFTRLANWLSENGFAVFGVGEAKTPLRFRLSCSGFYAAFAPPRPEPAPVSLPPAPPPANPPAAASGQIKAAVTNPVPSPPSEAKKHAATTRLIRKRLAGAGGMAPLSAIGTWMKAEPGVKAIETTKYRDWRAFIKARHNVFSMHGDGVDPQIRLVRTTPA